jgi:diguanylate cyclase (GGDEF)-like protein
MRAKKYRIFQSNILRIVFILTVLTVLLFIIYVIYVQQPSFTKLIQENTRNEAVRIASHLSSLLITGNDEFNQESLSANHLEKISGLQYDSHFIKLKIYSPTGEIMYSTDPKEIGNINEEAYLQEILKSGEVRTKEVKKNIETLERQLMDTDVMETYVPIVRDNKTLGVFEVYYDISLQYKKLHTLTSRSSAIIFFMATLLMSAIVISILKTNQYMKERRLAEEDLRALSLTDELTGLYNRRGFFTMSEQQIKMAKRLKRGILLIATDLNGLKKINDTLGHKEGDHALIEAARIIKDSFRESDIIARIGGDEFVILMLEKPEISQEILAARLLKKLDNFNTTKVHRYRLSISFGMAYNRPENPCSIDEMLVKADRLMYRQKSLKHRI